MSAGDWLPRGWSCEHRRSKSFGPCEKCLPGDGRCRDCKKPLDEHSGLGTINFHCPQKADAK